MRRPEIVKQISDAVRHYDPTATTIIYGSEARGDARPDSDIDVLILVDSSHLTPKQAENYAYPLYEIEWSTGIPISTMVLTRNQWENRPIVTPFYKNINKEGVVV